MVGGKVLITETDDPCKPVVISGNNAKDDIQKIMVEVTHPITRGRKGEIRVK